MPNRATCPRYTGRSEMRFTLMKEGFLGRENPTRRSLIFLTDLPSRYGGQWGKSLSDISERSTIIGVSGVKLRLMTQYHGLCSSSSANWVATRKYGITLLDSTKM